MVTSLNRARARIPVIAVALMAGAITLSGCGSNSDSAATDDTASSSSATVLVTDAWIRTTDGTMTGIFGVISNTTDEDITIDSASNTASSMTELHEMAMIDGQMVMQEKAGGVVLPAGQQVVLEPGADHIMAMGLIAPVVAGEEVEVTLTLSNGETLSFMAIGKESAAGDESYHSDDMSSDDMMSDGDMP
ncbi:MAG: copper chaperone PCu(A)C [Candidatus Nanopelagicales bacterium]